MTQTSLVHSWVVHYIHGELIVLLFNPFRPILIFLRIRYLRKATIVAFAPASV